MDFTNEVSGDIQNLDEMAPFIMCPYSPVQNPESVEQHRQEDHEVPRGGRRQRKVPRRHREDQSLDLSRGPGTDEGVPDAGAAHRQDDLQRVAPLQHPGEGGFTAGQDHQSGKKPLSS